MRTPPEVIFQAEIDARVALERTQARDAATNLLAAIRDDDLDALHAAIDIINNETIGGWEIAIPLIAKLPRASDQIRAALQRYWIEMKSMRRSAVNDFVMVDCLRVMFPRYRGRRNVTLYRGETFLARCRGNYGISWTYDKAIAEGFATGSMQLYPSGSVLLKTVAPPEAIIATTLDADLFGEREYLVDRRRLRRVEVVKRFHQRTAPQ